MDDNSTEHWSQGLLTVIYAINTRTTHTTKKSPYELVFGQTPRSNLHYWKDLHDLASQDLVEYGDLIIDKISNTNMNDNLGQEKEHDDEQQEESQKELSSQEEEPQLSQQQQQQSIDILPLPVCTRGSY